MITLAELFYRMTTGNFEPGQKYNTAEGITLEAVSTTQAILSNETRRYLLDYTDYFREE